MSRTMETWINSTVANKEMISWGVSTTGEKWSFRINANGTIRAEVSGGFIYGTTNVANGQWHHVACVLSGTDIATAQLYVDGVLETVGANQSQTVNTNTTTNLTRQVLSTIQYCTCTACPRTMVQPSQWQNKSVPYLEPISAETARCRTMK